MESLVAAEDLAGRIALVREVLVAYAAEAAESSGLVDMEEEDLAAATVQDPGAGLRCWAERSMDEVAATAVLRNWWMDGRPVVSCSLTSSDSEAKQARMK